MDNRNLWVTWAAFVAALGASLAVAAVAWQDRGGNSRWWWTASVAMFLAAIVIALFGLMRPWTRARRLWRQPEIFQSRPPGWLVGHQFRGNGVLLAVGKAKDAQPEPLAFYLCELKRKGSDLAYIARFDHGREPMPRGQRATAFYPDEFEGTDGSPAPSIHHDALTGCLMQVWWAYDPATMAPVAVAQECFGVFPLGRYKDRKERRCKESCPN